MPYIVYGTLLVLTGWLFTRRNKPLFDESYPSPRFRIGDRVKIDETVPESSRSYSYLGTAGGTILQMRKAVSRETPKPINTWEYKIQSSNPNDTGVYFIYDYNLRPFR